MLADCCRPLHRGLRRSSGCQAPPARPHQLVSRHQRRLLPRTCRKICAAADGNTISPDRLSEIEELLAKEYSPDRLILDLEGGVLKLQLAADTFEGMAMAERQKRLGQFLDTHAPGLQRELMLMTPREYFAGQLKKWC